MDYAELKKLDEDSANKMVEGSGPVDECICSLLAPSGGGRKSISRSIKKVLATITPGKTKKSGRGRAVVGGGFGGGGGVFGGGRGGGGGSYPVGGAGIEIPLVFSKGEQGIYTTKEVMKRKGSCGKCGCDKEKIVMKHSYANIRITSPDVSSICPCPTSCLPDKAKLMNNIKVTVEHMRIDPDSENSESSLHQPRLPRKLQEPDMTDKRSVTSLINAQYDTDEDKLYDRITIDQKNSI
ncbi:hypothetical protein PYW07_013310 [Mythimna separata]|uniref:Uncharacterized protein n=1 Tax=Mythimna separata TaxID=271217 RepID=A0AAD7Y640_MYTSE|nr:hypothetical protein PYW07_013310 [Mythimna separata]